MAKLLLYVSMLLVVLPAPGQAQWPAWANEIFGDGMSRRYERQPRAPFEEREPAEPFGGPAVADGGARPEIRAQAPNVVDFPHAYPASSIVISTSDRRLYYVLGNNRAYAYPISVGREGFEWTGSEVISRKQAWPDWHPPLEMRERDPKLPEKMTGGVRNPLGAMALYLGTSLYRIHGTNDVKSIGQAQSSGCFRMMNSAVMHLAGLADIGTAVVVVSALPKAQIVSRAPEPVTEKPVTEKPAAEKPTVERRAAGQPAVEATVQHGYRPPGGSMQSDNELGGYVPGG